MIALVAEFDGREFEYGKVDCVQFVCRWISLVSGWSPAYESRFQYNCAIGASKLIVDNGGSLASLVSSVLGEPHDEAQRGDVVVSRIKHRDESIDAMGVYNGRAVLGIIPDIVGVSRYGGSQILCAWSPCRT